MTCSNSDHRVARAKISGRNISPLCHSHLLLSLIITNYGRLPKAQEYKENLDLQFEMKINEYQS